MISSNNLSKPRASLIRIGLSASAYVAVFLAVHYGLTAAGVWDPAIAGIAHWVIEESARSVVRICRRAE